jgi:hypothetical protein
MNAGRTPRGRRCTTDSRFSPGRDTTTWVERIDEELLALPFDFSCTAVEFREHRGGYHSSRNA